MPTVLLIEDDESIRNMYTNGLGREGFEVAAISNADEALTVVASQTFDFILLDMLLGGMSGIDFLQAADLPVKSPQTRVIALSNIGSDSIKERAKTLGVVDFLSKVDFNSIQLAAYLKGLPGPAPAEPGVK